MPDSPDLRKLEAMLDGVLPPVVLPAEVVIEGTDKNALIEQLDTEQAQRRTITIRFLITPSEAAELKERCQGVKLSSYIRAGLFNYPRPRPRAVVPQVNRDSYLELLRIGNNINQQTRAMNQLIKNPTEPILINQLSIYSQQLQALTELLYDLRRSLVPKPEPLDDGEVE